MFACLPGWLPACLSVSLPACLVGSLAACLAAWLAACLPPSLAACLPASLAACLPACLADQLAVGVFVFLTAGLSLCLSDDLLGRLVVCLVICRLALLSDVFLFLSQTQEVGRLERRNTELAERLSGQQTAAADQLTKLQERVSAAVEENVVLVDEQTKAIQENIAIRDELVRVTEANVALKTAQVKLSDEKSRLSIGDRNKTAQIDNLTRDLADVKTRMDGLERQRDSLQGQVSTLQKVLADRVCFFYLKIPLLVHFFHNLHTKLMSGMAGIGKRRYFE